MPVDQRDKERARMELEDAIFRCIELGMTRDDVKAEVDYVLETMDE